MSQLLQTFAESCKHLQSGHQFYLFFVSTSVNFYRILPDRIKKATKLYPILDIKEVYFISRMRCRQSHIPLDITNTVQIHPQPPSGHKLTASALLLLQEESVGCTAMMMYNHSESSTSESSSSSNDWDPLWNIEPSTEDGTLFFGGPVLVEQGRIKKSTQKFIFS